MGAVASRAAVAVCVVLVTAGAVGGCGGGGSQHSRPKPSATAATASTRPFTTARTLTQSDLERAVIGPKDVPGWKTSTLVGRGGDGADIAPVIVDVSRMPRVSPADCEPLADMTGLMGRHQYSAIVRQDLRPASDKDERTDEMSLTSYGVAGAVKVIADLRTSLRTCSSFGSADPGQTGETGETWAHLVPLTDPKLGDEAVAYGITQSVPSVDSNGDDDGGAPVKVPFHFVVVRSGATIVAFDSMNVANQVQLPQVPMDVVKAQIDKLDRVR